MVACVYVDLPQPAGAGVDELVRNAGRHHNDLPAPRLDNVVPAGEGRAALKELAEPKPEPSSLEYHQQQATARTEAGDRAAFSAAQHYVAGYLRARHTPVSVIADELVDDAGEPLGVPQMARVLPERMPDLALGSEE
jgi:hypothetical protein